VVVGGVVSTPEASSVVGPFLLSLGYIVSMRYAAQAEATFMR
jgi:hypothetical protein